MSDLIERLKDRQDMTPAEVAAFPLTLPVPPVGWSIITDTTDPWVVTLVDEFDSKKISIKWDGCAHYYRTFNGASATKEENGTDDNLNYLHICDLERWAKEILKLAQYARDIGVYTE